MEAARPFETSANHQNTRLHNPRDIHGRRLRAFLSLLAGEALPLGTASQSAGALRSARCRHGNFRRAHRALMHEKTDGEGTAVAYWSWCSRGTRRPRAREHDWHVGSTILLAVHCIIKNWPITHRTDAEHHKMLLSFGLRHRGCCCSRLFIHVPGGYVHRAAWMARSPPRLHSGVKTPQGPEANAKDVL
jgi:hypothetical protein